MRVDCASHGDHPSSERIGRLNLLHDSDEQPSTHCRSASDVLLRLPRTPTSTILGFSIPDGDWGLNSHVPDGGPSWSANEPSPAALAL
ncbi:unnamed protein product [Peniophora sp. CBMAI 1063]|nr:unnamed protein product [Peniophora sp. CBMAI 1063]